MEVRNYGNKRILIADNNKHIRSIDDAYVEEHYEDGILIPEYKPYYTSVIYLADNFDISKIKDLYVEEDM